MTDPTDLQQRHDETLDAVLGTAKAVADRARELALSQEGEPQQQLGVIEAAARTVREAAEAVAAMLGPHSAGDPAAIADLREQLVDTSRSAAGTAEALEAVQEQLTGRLDDLEAAIAKTGAATTKPPAAKA